MTRWPRVALAAAALLAAGLACRDAVGPGARAMRSASLSIVAPADLIAPDGGRLEVDNGLVRITRADGTVALERPFDFPAGQQAVQLTLDIPLNQPTESFTAGIRLFNGTTLLFQTSGPITVSFGSDNPSPQLPTLVYAGPGSSVTSLTLAPRDTVLTAGDSVRFRSTALAGQQPVSAFFVNLETSDPQVPVGVNGFVVAPNRRATLRVRGLVFGTTVRDSTTLTIVPRPSVVAAVAGNAQVGTVGTALSTPLRVRVSAPDGFGVPNVPVAFATSTAGASVATPAVRTDANGFAETIATLGPAAGPQGFTATVAGLAPVAFAATATAGALASLQVTTAPPATVFAEQPFDVAVLGLDALNNPTPLPTPVTVAFGTRPGTATLGGTVSVTPSGNTATFTALRASRPGTGGTLRISAGAIQVTTSAFAVINGPATLLSLEVGTPPAAAPAGGTLADSLVYRLLDDRNVPIAGATMSFTLGGQVGTVGRTTAITDTAGRGSPGPWRLASLAGANTLRANVGALQSGLLSVTGTAGTLASLAFTTAPPASVRAEAPFTVVVEGRDATGNPVALPTPVSVAFGTVPGIATLGGVTSVTPVGAAATFDALRASRPGTGGTLVVTAGAFTATSPAFDVTVGPVAAVVVASGAPPASAVVGTALPDSIVWRVVDDRAVPISGQTMTFALSGQIGTLGRLSAVTDTAGRASAGPWTLATTAGSNTLTATVGVVQGPGIFVTGTAGAPATVGAVAGNAQTATVNTAVATAPRVRVNDASGNPVPGAAVTFAVTSGGGSITGATATTDAAGLATVGSWTLGTTAGANSLTATVGALPPATFTATGTAGAPTVMDIGAPAGGTQTGTAGQPVAVNPTVRLRDAFGNAVPGVTVTFAVTGGGGTVSGATVVTDVAGVAAVGGWTLGPTPGTNTLRATAGALVADFTATSGTLVATRLIPAVLEGLASRAGQPTPGPIAIFTETSGGVRVPGTLVRYWVIGANGQQLAGTAGTVTSDASGIASIPPFVVSTEPGSYLLNLRSAQASNGVTISVAGDPATLAPFGSTSITVAAGAPFPEALEASVFDAIGSNVPQAAVIVSRSAPDAIGPAAQNASAVFLRTSDASGRVSFTETAPAQPGTYTYRMVVDGAVPTTFVVRVTGPAGGATRLLSPAQGDGQRTAAGTAPTLAPQFLLTDVSGTPAAGETVTFDRVDPSGAVTPAGSAVTDATGVVTLPGPFVTSATPGLNQIVATAAGARPAFVSVSGYGPIAVLLRVLPSTYLPQATGTLAAPAPIVRAVDVNGTPVPGVLLTVTNTQPGPLVDPITLPVRFVTTDATGAASLSFPIGVRDGLNTMTFSVGAVVLQFVIQGLPPGG